MGNKATKKITEHPLTTAILEKNLPLFEDLMTEHLDSLGKIRVSLPNEDEVFTNDRLRYGRDFNLTFLPFNRNKTLLHEETLLETASRIGWLQGVELLLDRGVSPRHDKRVAFHDPPCALLWACKEGHVDVVKVLLEKGADVECFHKRNTTGASRRPLNIAVSYGRLPVAQVLIDRGANIQVHLSHILFEGRKEFIKLLIGAGYDVTSDDWHETMRQRLYLEWEYVSAEFLNEFLVLWMQAGGTINVEKIIGANEYEGLQEEYGGDRDHQAGLRERVAYQMQQYKDGKLYRLTFLDMCRIVIRKKLIEHAQGKSIFPAIRSLPLPMKMKNFLSFGYVKE